MKKLILPIVLCLLTLSNVNATEVEPIKRAKTVNNSVEGLLLSIRKGDYAKVKEMLNNGQKVNEKLNDFTPIMYAARYNRGKIAKLLIGHGAKMNDVVYKKGDLSVVKLSRKYNSRETFNVIKEVMEDKKQKETTR